VNHVELVAVLCQIFQRVGLVELEWIVRLWRYIHAYHLKACAMVAHACAPSPTKQIE